MRHSLKISVSKNVPPDGGIVRCIRLPIRERIMRMLFGDRKRLTILVPGDSVEEVHIKEVEGT